MRIAAVQMNTTEDIDKNLKKAEKFFFQALERGAKLVSFPECFLHLSESRTEINQEAQSLTSPLTQEIRKWARTNKTWILAGSLYFKAGKKVTNTSLLIDDYGKIRARYDKMHLFDIEGSDRSYRESASTTPGKKPVTTGPYGLSVCYDLRFPELYRVMAQRRVEVVFAPSAFTVPTGKAHWDVLTRARAIENQVYLICPAQVGSPYPGRITYGHSRIVDPWGEVVCEKKSGEGVIVTDADRTRIQQIRKRLPALQHRKIKTASRGTPSH